MNLNSGRGSRMCLCSVWIVDGRRLMSLQASSDSRRYSGAMGASAVVGKPILRIRGTGPGEALTDDVAVEEPLEIRIHGDPLATTMRTPGHDAQLAAGFLFAEGIVHSADDLGSLVHCGRPDEAGFGNVIDVIAAPGVHLEVERVRTAKRGTLTTSACGVCGRQNIDDLLALTGRLQDSVTRVDGTLIARAPDLLRATQRHFDKTGGMHGAALLDQTGAVLAAAEDVGRHNAVDKVVGQLVLNRALDRGGAPGTRAALRPRASGPAPALLVVSGRASFEILQKAAVARIPVVAAVGAPSSLAVELAERCNLTLCAFVRPGSFNVYTASERLST